MGVPHCGSTSGGYWVVSHGQNFLVQKNFELNERPCLFSRWRPETGNFLVWPCKKFYHKRIFSELGACPGSNESKGNSTCKEEIQKNTKNTKIPKKSLQPRNSWGWSTIRSCDIVWYRASVRHRRNPRYLCVASSRCRYWSQCCMISHDRTADQSHEYLGCNDFFFGQGSIFKSHVDFCKRYGIDLAMAQRSLP